MEIDTIDKSYNQTEQNHETKEEKDLYMHMRELERELELLSMQEEFLKDEQRHLKSEYIRSKEEVSCLQYLVNSFRLSEFSLSIWKPRISLKW